MVYTEHPTTKQHNLGIYRMQVYDAETAGLHWQIQKGGGFHYHAAERLGQPLPVTVFLGGPPALLVSAVAPLPENVPELMLASLLQGEKLRVAQAPDAEHRLIAEAEFALVGNAPPNERRVEVPSEIITATTRFSTNIQSFIATRSITGATPFIRQLSSASRGRKTFSSVITCSRFCRRCSP